MDEVQIFDGLEFEPSLNIDDAKLESFVNRILEAPIDTRKALQNYVPNADEYQKSVIFASENKIKVVAPAGSGKTQTVINRVLEKIGKGANPERLLVLTFDNSAVGAVRTKLESQLKKQRVKLDSEPVIRTLNAYGYQVLREYVVEEYKPIIEDYRRRRLLKDVKEELKNKSLERFNALPKKIRDNYYTEYFSLLKNELFDPRDFDSQRFTEYVLGGVQSEPFFENPQNKQSVTFVIQSLIWLFKALDLAMRQHKLMDFDDQKLRAYKAIINNQELRNILQNKYTEIIVDEFQDINKLDFEFLRILSEKTKLIVVGDDDQAIYGFRGCTPDYIIDLDRHLNHRVASYELSINYRCPPNIIAHADRLIKNNTRRIPKNPIAGPENKNNADIKVVSSISPSVEAKIIRSYIQKVKREKEKKGEFGFQNFVVLYRTNAQSLPIQIEFILKGIPYYVREEDNILKNQVLEKIISVLQLKLDISRGIKPSAKDCTRTIQSYYRYISASEEEALYTKFNSHHDFLHLITSGPFLEILPKARGNSLSDTIIELLETKTLMDTLDLLSTKFNGLYGLLGGLEDVLDEKVPLGEIFDIAASFKGNIEDFLKTIGQALDWAKNNNAGKDLDNGVGLRTYFRAKGLQWDTVILTTCNEGMIPHRRAPLEDERRLFYVALTRASSNLFISYVKNVCNNSVRPSRFLGEAGFL
jgi:DNA helicase-2/ATP-dependent DNA helicase PcrA